MHTLAQTFFLFFFLSCQSSVAIDHRLYLLLQRLELRQALFCACRLVAIVNCSLEGFDNAPQQQPAAAQFLLCSNALVGCGEGNKSVLKSVNTKIMNTHINEPPF